MHPAHIIAARSNGFGLGPAESIAILIILLVLFSGYALPQRVRTHSDGGRLTPKEIYFISTLGVLLAAAIAVIVWQGTAR